MMTIPLILLFITNLTFAGTQLLLVGGGLRPIEAMEEFVTSAGGRNSNLLVIPWASQTFEGAESIKKELMQSHPGSVEIIRDFSDLEKKIKKATGIFFTGGDQNKLMKEIEATGTMELLKDAFASGIIFGGTSAGTAIMSDPMLSGVADTTVIDASKVELVKGLGLLPGNVIVDQHFIVRGRFNRLAGIILQRNNIIGLGVDENTALLISGREAKVIGPSQVLVFEKLRDDELKVKVLRKGDRYLLP